MSSNPDAYIPGRVEQDAVQPGGGGGDELPSYDDLAAQNGPNSRFGRWRGWIEKRAAERYMDITPEERQRRKERGWELRDDSGPSSYGNGYDQGGGMPNVFESSSSQAPPTILYTNAPPVPGGAPMAAPMGMSTMNMSGGTLPPHPAAHLGQHQHHHNPMHNLHIQTANLSLSPSPSGLPGTHPHSRSHSPHTSLSEIQQLPFVSQTLRPSHLKINHFGSRFLPHATSPIKCILPLMADRLVLIGTEEGLSVLDMFPKEWVEESGEMLVKRPNEAQSWVIWRGETVHQMTILEIEETGEGTQQGVVLMLVGPEVSSPASRHASDSADFRILRMYNLSSLTSLARWAVSQKGKAPLDMQKHAGSMQQSQNPQTTTPPSKRHRPQGSIARSIKSLINDSSSSGPLTEHPTSYYSLLTSPTSGSGTPNFAHGGPPYPRAPSPMRHDSGESTWEVLSVTEENLPVRWAMDFVPLASPGSRLSSNSALFYATWSDRGRGGTRQVGGQLLAIATKNSILLYESPKGERAYRFVKDFYTPLQPRSMCFFHQHATQEQGRPSSEIPRGKRYEPEPSSSPISYGIQICLFVVFDKKAGWIRLADSAVGEFELRDDAGPAPSAMATGSPRDSLSPALGSMTGRTRARLSFEIRESVAKWILPSQCDLPTRDPHQPSRTVVFLTRGRRTHLIYSPLPTRLASVQPLHVIYWKNTPRQVSARVCLPARANVGAARYPGGKTPFLQVVGFGDGGLEVYETSLASLDGDSGGSGKGKTKAMGANYPPDHPTVRAEEDLGGDVGYLQAGGNWDQADELYSGAMGAALDRMDSVSGASMYTYSSVETEDALVLLKQEAGMYGWCRKGVEDYRIFWVGGCYDAAGQGGEEGSAGSYYG